MSSFFQVRHDVPRSALPVLQREVVRGRGQDEAVRRCPTAPTKREAARQDAHADAHTGQDAGKKRVSPVPVEGQWYGEDGREDERP